MLNLEGFLPLKEYLVATFSITRELTSKENVTLRSMNVSKPSQFVINVATCCTFTKHKKHILRSKCT